MSTTVTPTKRMILLKEIQDEIKAEKFFKTVKRGQASMRCEKPVCLIKTADWNDKKRNGVDDRGRSQVLVSFRLVIGVFVDNDENTDGDVISDLLENAVGVVQKVLERGDRKLGGKAITITPVGGMESTLEDLMPIADVMLVYEVLYERPLGEP